MSLLWGRGEGWVGLCLPPSSRQGLGVTVRGGRGRVGSLLRMGVHGLCVRVCGHALQA